MGSWMEILLEGQVCIYVCEREREKRERLGVWILDMLSLRCLFSLHMEMSSGQLEVWNYGVGLQHLYSIYNYETCCYLQGTECRQRN